MHERRPLSEKVDGGQIAQNGVHAMRFVEHITGLQAVTVQAMQTGLGEMRADSDLQMASTVMGQLSNGGLFSIIANYLNPTGFGSWGNEMVRIFGTKGMVESTDGGKRTRLVVGDEDRGPLDTSVDAPDWLTMVLDDVQGCSSMLIDLETELHPTRMVLRARSVAQQINKP
jgi:predicted dehydrogenase